MFLRLLKYIIILYPFLIQANDKIDRLFEDNQELTRKINIAIQVRDLKTGEGVYSLSPDRLMIPASTTKSFTAYCALEYLRPDFTYSTQILFDKSKIDTNGVLSDNLYIKFSGDPSLTRDEFSKLILDLKKYNINSINGDIVIDDSVFDQYYKADGWSWDDGKFCFAAPTSAIVIDKNCFYLDLSPSKTIGEPATLAGGSLVDFMKNKIITQDDPSCSPDLRAYQDNYYILTGCIDIKAKTIPLSIAYQDPGRMGFNLIKKLFNKHKIDSPRKVAFFKPTSPEYKVMLEHKSLPLAELVKQMHKTSDNIAADNFLKTIGAKYYNTQGSFKNGTKAMAEITGNKEMRISDGSGGSRYNLVSPNHLVDLFILGRKNQIFYDSLMLSGADGPLEARFPESLNGRIRAKTGSMSGVTNLVGYLTKDDGQTLVFAIMINSCMDKKSCDKLTDQVLEILAKS